VISIVLSLPGGVIGDMFARKPLLFAFACIAAPLQLIYLFPVHFTVVILMMLWQSITGSLLAPARSAFQADCLPRDANGMPSDPSRDSALNMYQSILPGLVMPLLGGQMFIWFPDHFFVYKLMFVWSTVIAIVCAAIFYHIDPEAEFKEAQVRGHRAVRNERTASSDTSAGYKTPIGARMCDRLMFRSLTVRESQVDARAIQ
jgi:MFS family permease